MPKMKKKMKVKKTAVKAKKTKPVKKTKAKAKTVKKAKKVVRKKAKVQAIPKGYHTLTPYLIIDNAREAIEFYKKAFGAKEIFVMEKDGKIGHAEMKFGDSMVMLADEYPQMNARGPKSIGGSPVSMHLYMKDVDQVIKQAVAAGATLTHPVSDKFYGDRSGGVIDPFGHSWHVSTHIEDVPPKELKRRAEEFCAAQGQKEETAEIAEETM